MKGLRLTTHSLRMPKPGLLTTASQLASTSEKETCSRATAWMFWQPAHASGRTVKNSCPCRASTSRRAASFQSSDVNDSSTQRRPGSAPVSRAISARRSRPGRASSGTSTCFGKTDIAGENGSFSKTRACR